MSRSVPECGSTALKVHDTALAEANDSRSGETFYYLAAGKVSGDDDVPLCTVSRPNKSGVAQRFPPHSVTLRDTQSRAPIAMIGTASQSRFTYITPRMMIECPGKEHIYG